MTSPVCNGLFMFPRKAGGGGALLHYCIIAIPRIIQVRHNQAWLICHILFYTKYVVLIYFLSSSAK